MPYVSLMQPRCVSPDDESVSPQHRCIACVVTSKRARPCVTQGSCLPSHLYTSSAKLQLACHELGRLPTAAMIPGVGLLGCLLIHLISGEFGPNQSQSQHQVSVPTPGSASYRLLSLSGNRHDWMPMGQTACRSTNATVPVRVNCRGRSLPRR